MDLPGGSALTDIPDILARHTQQIYRRRLVLAGLALCLVLAFLVDLTTGPSSVTVQDVWRALTGDLTLPVGKSTIVWRLRLPTALLAILVGAALGLAGAEMQTVLDNPLASPFTLGVSSAAAFGAAIAITFGAGLPFLPPEFLVAGNAFIFAFGSVMLLQLLMRGRENDTTLLILYGIAVVFTFNALVSLVQFIAPAEAVKHLALWGMGNLAVADAGRLMALAAAVLVVAPFSLLASSRLTALRLGLERAASLGIDLRSLSRFSLLRISLLTATAVAAAGTIGFVGLVGPHIARMLVGEDHRFYLPASLMTGALLVSLASVASKTIIPGLLLPVGIVTSLVGLPLFFALINRSRRAPA